MRNSILLILILAVSFISCDKLEMDEKQSQDVIIKNSDPVINFSIWFKTGSAHDKEGQEGVANLTAQMLTEASTKNNSFSEIQEKLYPIASSYSSKVDKEMIVVRGATHKDNLDKFYSLFVDALINPKFSNSDFSRIKENTKNNIENTLRYSSDEELGKATLYNAIFKDTPYEHLTEGTLSSLESMKLWDIKKFYKDQFNNENFVIGLSGDFPDSLVEKLRNDLTNGLPPKVLSDTLKVNPAPIEGLNFVMVEKNTNSTAISFGFPIELTRSNDDYYALDLFRSWFGEHRNSSSHLYGVIREARGLNYGDYAYIEAYLNGGSRTMPDPNNPRSSQIFQVWIRPVQHMHRHFALRAAMRELQLVVDNGMTQADFDKTKSFLDKYCLHYAPTNSDRLGYQIDSKFYGIEDGGSYINHYRKKINELTLEQVNNAIKKYIQYDNMVLAFVTQDSEKFKNDLVSNASSPIEYTSPKPDEVLKVDEEIINYQINADESKFTVIKVEDMFVK